MLIIQQRGSHLRLLLMNWCKTPARSQSGVQEMFSMTLSVFKRREGSVFICSRKHFHSTFDGSSTLYNQFTFKPKSRQEKSFGHGWSVEARGSDHIIRDQIWIFISMPVVNGVKLQPCHWLTLHQYSRGPFYAWELLENWMLNRSFSSCTESDERVRLPPIQIHQTLWCLLE